MLITDTFKAFLPVLVFSSFYAELATVKLAQVGETPKDGRRVTMPSAHATKPLSLINNFERGDRTASERKTRKAGEP